MVLLGLIHSGASISMTVDRSTSSIARAEYSGPPANGRYRPRFTIVAARPTPPPAVFRKLLRFTSLLAFEPCLSTPERVQIRTASFLNGPTRNVMHACGGRGAAVAFPALAPAGDGAPAAAVPRIDHFVIEVRAKRTPHEARAPC